LDLEVERDADGKYLISAPWLEEVIVADSFENGYWQAISRHPRKG
jgi:hypothetical protein